MSSSLTEELAEIKELLRTNKKVKKPKKFKLPWGARVGNSKLKKGYVTIQIIEENGSLSFRKEPIVDGTIQLGDSYHAIEDMDILYYKGKPFVIQAKNKLNPYNPLKGEHETYGQKYVMARMEKDRILGKKNLGWGVGIVGLIIGAVVIYALITGGA